MIDRPQPIPAEVLAELEQEKRTAAPKIRELDAAIRTKIKRLNVPEAHQEAVLALIAPLINAGFIKTNIGLEHFAPAADTYEAATNRLQEALEKAFGVQAGKGALSPHEAPITQAMYEIDGLVLEILTPENPKRTL